MDLRLVQETVQDRRGAGHISQKFAPVYLLALNRKAVHAVHHSRSTVLLAYS